MSSSLRFFSRVGHISKTTAPLHHFAIFFNYIIMLSVVQSWCSRGAVVVQLWCSCSPIWRTAPRRKCSTDAGLVSSGAVVQLEMHGVGSGVWSFPSPSGSPQALGSLEKGYLVGFFYNHLKHSVLHIPSGLVQRMCCLSSCLPTKTAYTKLEKAEWSSQ